MGFGGISLSQLLILLVVVILVFGTKKLRHLGGDLGSALKSFRKALSSDDKEDKEDKPEHLPEKDDQSKSDKTDKQA